MLSVSQTIQSNHHDYQDPKINIEGAIKAALKLSANTLEDQLHEILGCAPESENQCDLQFRKINDTSYLIFTNEDNGLKDEDIQRLLTFYVGGFKGHSEWGLGAKANAYKMTQTYINDHDNVTQGQFYITDKFRSVVYHVSQDYYSPKIQQLEGSDTEKLYKDAKSIIDRDSSNNTKWIIPFDLYNQANYINRPDQLINDITLDLKFRWNKKISNGFKFFVQNNLIKIDYNPWPISHHIQIYKDISFKSKKYTIHCIDDDIYIYQRNCHGECIKLPEEEKDKICLFTKKPNYQFMFYTNNNITDKEVRDKIFIEFNKKHVEQHGVFYSKNNVLISISPGFVIGRSQSPDPSKYFSALIENFSGSDIASTNPIKSHKPTFARQITNFIRWYYYGIFFPKNNPEVLQTENGNMQSSQKLAVSDNEVSKINRNNTKDLNSFNLSHDSKVSKLDFNSISCEDNSSDNNLKSEIMNNKNVTLNNKSESVSILTDNSMSDSDVDSHERNDFSTKVRKQKLSEQNCRCPDLSKGGGGINIDELKKYAPDYVCPLNGSKFPQVGGDFIYEADHIIPRCKGGKGTYDNCQILCHMCHAVKTKIESLR